MASKHASATVPLATRVVRAANAIAAKLPCRPEVGVVLGSSMGAFADAVQGAVRFAYATLPYFAVPHVEGHVGELVVGHIGRTPCAVLGGRIHYYEGYAMQEVTFAVRVLQALGVRRLIVTNAAGGLNIGFQPGEMMVITDHINLTGVNPLRGPHSPELGVRFLDMSAAYSPEGQAAWHAAAKGLPLRLHAGVYLGLSGPSYETPAEVQMLQRLGADAVGMSTVAEVTVARHCGMQVAGLSVITNRAAGLTAAPLSHQEVTEVAARVRGPLCTLLATMVRTWQ